MKYLRRLKPSPLTTFSLVSFVITAVIAAVLAVRIQQELEQLALRQEAESAAEQVDLLIDPNLESTDLAGPLDPARYKQIDVLMHDILIDQHIVRVKIWNRDGLLIYSDEKELVGRHFPVTEDLQQALNGQMTMDVSSLDKAENVLEKGRFGSQLLEVYIPLRIHDSLQVVGSYEIYHDLSMVEPLIAETRRLVWGSVVLGFSILYGALFTLVRGVSRELVRRNDENARLYEEATQRLVERKQAEEALQKSEIKFRSLVESASDAILLADNSGNVVSWNAGAQRIFGYEAQEVLGKSVAPLISQQYREMYQKSLEQNQFVDMLGVIHGKTIEMRGVNKEGAEIPLEVSLATWKTGSQDFYSAIIRNITTRKQVEMALRESEKRFRLIARAVSDAAWDRDLVTSELWQSLGLRRLFGYPADYVTDYTWWVNTLHPEDRGGILDSMQKALDGEDHFWSGEYRFRRADGSYAYVLDRGYVIRDERGKPVRMIGAMVDFTERVLARQELEQRVEERTREIQRQRQVAEGLRDILAVLNSKRTLDETLDYIVDQTGRLLGTAAGAVYLQGEDGLLRIRASRGIDPQVIVLKIPVGVLPMGEAVQKRQPIAVSDASAAMLDLTSAELALAPQEQAALNNMFNCYPAWLAVPLIVKDEVYGAIVLFYYEPQVFSDETVRLTMAFGDQAALAIENARLFAEAEGKAVIEERQRLARDLHDSVSQSLYSLALLAEAGRRMTEAGDLGRAATYLSRLGETALQALKDMRLLVYELRPLVLVAEGLAGALQHRLDAVEKRAGVKTSLVTEGGVKLPPRVEVELFRVAQEALNNTLKHAMATEVTVTLGIHSGQVELEVADNGRSFDPNALSDTGGLGLVSMRERTEKLGGTFTIVSKPGQGTRVKVAVEI